MHRATDTCRDLRTVEISSEPPDSIVSLYNVDLAAGFVEAPAILKVNPCSNPQVPLSRSYSDCGWSLQLRVKQIPSYSTSSWTQTLSIERIALIPGVNKV
jgi:hypothetical protein